MRFDLGTRPLAQMLERFVIKAPAHSMLFLDATFHKLSSPLCSISIRMSDK